MTNDYREEIIRLKKVLAMEFKIKDLGFLKYFLGWKLLGQEKVFMFLNIHTF